ncbi:fimbria/pilus outer membrane usher protein [Dyella sp. ASV21]|uniref:fimbria/pilus outer membrane usher protein n=1 Tax=Dyella sp. ASV21 TaxID=2795114 RepID=UPI0018EC15CE|nr:fimbria/pilus outer membrane usher protein [Dyella sp. ASV21]
MKTSAFPSFAQLPQEHAINMPPRRLWLWMLLALGHLPSMAHAASAAGASGGAEPAGGYVEFNTDFTSNPDEKVDLSRFERSGVPAGTYVVDLYVNDRRIGREGIVFRDANGSGTATPCFNKSLLDRAGIDTSKLDPAALVSDCLVLPELIERATVSYDAGELRLNVDVPQLYTRKQGANDVDSSQWSEGQTAATLAYNVNSYRSDIKGGQSATNTYVGLKAGLNVDGWRFRAQTALTTGTNRPSHWQTSNVYAQHDVTALRSQFTVGDIFTPGDLFNSTSLRGANLRTDERMLPSGMVGFAPVIRGVAETRARVEVRQSGYLVYETSVSPGPFEITDLNGAAGTGDLEVLVIEADGRERRTIVPYAQVPRLLRPGQERYSVTVGQVRDNGQGLGNLPTVAEGTYQRGINNWLTGYGGVQATNGQLYRSALVGAAVTTPVGAFSLDVTESWAKPVQGQGTQTGHSTRATYSKMLEQTGTNFSLASYRYSSANYMDLDSAVRVRAAARKDVILALSPATGAKDQLQIALNQSLGDRAGSLYATGAFYSYWNNGGHSSTYQAGYSNRFKQLSYSISMGRDFTPGMRASTTVMFSGYLPLGKEVISSPTLSTSLSHNSRNGNNNQASVNGAVGEMSPLYYSVGAQSQDTVPTTINASVNWSARYGQLGAGYSGSSHSHQLSASAAGGVVVHGGGITLAPRIGETMAIVSAPDAAGSYIDGRRDARLDSRGYGVMSDLMPYRLNDVSLDPSGATMDGQLDYTSTSVAPRAGAVVAVKFTGSSGRAVMLRITQADGSVVPFGAQVLDEQGNEVGVVGQNGQVFVRGGETGGSLQLKWNDEQGGGCSVNYQLAGRDASRTKTSFEVLESRCRG